jgi:hypothetical protein
VFVRCFSCRAECDLPVTRQQLADWHGGALIQRVMPHLTAGERELLISGICGDCFDAMFRETADVSRAMVSGVNHDDTK